jgi:membrane-associated protein
MEFVSALVHFDRTLDVAIHQYGAAVYLLLFMIVFCETALLALFFLPGDPLLFISGALCAGGDLDIGALMALLYVAAVTGSALNYRIGQALGKTLSTRNYRWLNRDALRKTHDFYERNGALTIVVAPFIAVVRTFAPFVAGVSTMGFRKFMLYTLAGDALWIVILIPGGYFFGHLPVIRNHLDHIVLLGIGAGCGALLLGHVWKHYLRRKQAS